MSTYRHNPEGDENTAATRDNERAVFAAQQQAKTSRLDALLDQATKRSRFWITDAVANDDDISEAADDFVSENGRDSKYLANDILVELGEEPIFS